MAIITIVRYTVITSVIKITDLFCMIGAEQSFVGGSIIIFNYEIIIYLRRPRVVL